MISRRGFLGMLAGLAVEPVARKIYVFAPPKGWELSDSGLIYNVAPPYWNAEEPITLEMIQQAYERTWRGGTVIRQPIFYDSIPLESHVHETYGGISRSRSDSKIWTP